VTGGGSLQEAFHRFETLEFTGKTIIKARQIGNVRYLTDHDIALPAQRVVRSPELERGVPSSREKEG